MSKRSDITASSALNKTPKIRQILISVSEVRFSSQTMKACPEKSDEPTPILLRPATANPSRLGRDFFDVPGEELAKALLGQNIIRIVDGIRLSARIVETEAYLGAVDKAAHSYRRQTDRNKAMFMTPGTAYVYNIYGMYCCLNISSRGDGCAVLIRSVEPLEGIEKMQQLRKETSKKNTRRSEQLASSDVSASLSGHINSTSINKAKQQTKCSKTFAGATAPKPIKVCDLGNGPSKLCQSLAISKAALNQRDLVSDSTAWLEEGTVAVDSNSVVVSARINIAYAEEWTEKPLRFYILGNPCVSKRDKKAEAELMVTASTSVYY